MKIMVVILTQKISLSIRFGYSNLLLSSFTTYPWTSITLPLLFLLLSENPVFIFFASRYELIINKRSKDASIITQVRGLKKIRPNIRLNNIRKGNRHPLWAIKKRDLLIS